MTMQLGDGARVWAVVPAAGSGSRMQSSVPKQYLQVRGRAIAEYTLGNLLASRYVSSITVAVAADDPHWSSLPTALLERVTRVDGGASRARSVFNALMALQEHAAVNDWALVHDMARPCVQGPDMDAMLRALEADPVGGLLAIPVVDTLKRADTSQRVVETVPRDALWRAQTPQVFRFGMLLKALGDALESGFDITDEASAVEFAGHQPRLLEGPLENLKVTMPADLELVSRYLEQHPEMTICE